MGQVYEGFLKRSEEEAASRSSEGGPCGQGGQRQKVAVKIMHPGMKTSVESGALLLFLFVCGTCHVLSICLHQRWDFAGCKFAVVVLFLRWLRRWHVAWQQ